MTHMAKGPEEPRDPALARFVYERVAAALETETALAIAARTRVSRATMSNIKTGQGSYGIGRAVATDLLPVLGFKTYEELLEAAYAFARGDSPSRSRYRSLDELLHKHPDRWSAPAVAAMRSMRHPRDPGRDYWLRNLELAEPFLRALETQALPSTNPAPIERLDDMHSTRKKRR